MKEIIFISSVQSEFLNERAALAEYIREDALLKEFFEPFLFEEIQASGNSPSTVYLEKVAQSSIYLGLIGAEYGFENDEGISPTELEFDKARQLHKPCWIFINDNEKRHKKEVKLIAKMDKLVSRKKFKSIIHLKQEVYRSCILFLKQIGKIDGAEFDSSLHPTATIDDIDFEAVNNFVGEAKLKRNFPLKVSTPVSQILAHLKLYRDEKLTQSAIIAFSKDPQQFFPSATVKCAHFHGYVVEKPIPDLKEFKGTCFTLADNAVDFVLSKLSHSTGDRSQSNQVKTTYEIPRAVIAEAIINAIAHRDYYSRGSIQISVFKDRVEIENPGTLPQELDLEAIKKPHSSYPKNPLLAECMFLTGAIERFGTGIMDMFTLSAANGLKAPDFRNKKTFRVTLWRPSAQAAHDTAHDTAQEKEFLELDNLPLRLAFKLKGEMSRDEIMKQLDLTHRTNFRENYLNPASEKGFIEMTIPEKPTSKYQKYRLTKAGELALKNIKK